MVYSAVPSGYFAGYFAQNEQEEVLISLV
jgi:hypothetical protein